MRIAIVGSRNYPNKKDVVDYVKALPRDTIVVSGGAKGVDSWAEVAAKRRGLKTEIRRPEWSKYGRSAGFKRNADLVMSADKVVAFTTGSKGTAHAIRLAKRYGRELEIYRENLSEWPDSEQPPLFKEMPGFAVSDPRRTKKHE